MQQLFSDIGSWWSSLHIEIQKILLDKGLLGLIAILFTVATGLLLERYKTNLKLFEQNITMRRQLHPSIIGSLDEWSTEMMQQAKLVREKQNVVTQWVEDCKNAARMKLPPTAFEAASDIIDLRFHNSEINIIEDMDQLASSRQLGSSLLDIVSNKESEFSKQFVKICSKKSIFREEIRLLAYLACKEMPSVFTAERTASLDLIARVHEEVLFATLKNKRLDNAITTICIGIIDYVQLSVFNEQIKTNNPYDKENFEIMIRDTRGALKTEITRWLLAS